MAHIILTQNNYYPKPKYLIIGYMDPLERFSDLEHKFERSQAASVGLCKLGAPGLGV